MIGLYKFNARTGFWQLERACDQANAQQWLAIFQGDEPSAKFVLSKNKPSKAPKH